MLTAAVGQERTQSTLKNGTSEVMLLPNCLQLDMSKTWLNLDYINSIAQ